MKRALTKQLRAWKNQPRKKPLVLCGARQVGKTHVLKDLGHTDYESLAYVDLLTDEAKAVFKGGYDACRTLENIEILTGTRISPGKTLVVIDEIQEVPEALPLMKAFAEQLPDYDIAAAGSYLGVALHASKSFPVGKVKLLDLHPLSFVEFMQAMGEESLAKVANGCDFEHAKPFAERLERLVRQYCFVGGMPEAVVRFIEGGSDYDAARKIQLDLLRAYDHDFSKHVANERELARTRLAYSSIPAHLGRENHKFVFGHIAKGARARDYETCIQWITDSGLATRVYRADKPIKPLSFYRDLSAFKLYLHDVGLLGAAMEIEAADVILSNKALEEYKGAMAEQYVCQQLAAAGLTPFYWSRDGSSKAEVDFAFSWNGTIAPLEVKAEENLRAKSLRGLCTETGLHGYRCSMADYREQDWMTNIPLWAVGPFFAQENKTN